MRVMLADSPTFRAWVFADNQAEALAKIYDEGLPLPNDREVMQYTVEELFNYRSYAEVYTQGVITVHDGVSSDSDDYAPSGEIAFGLFGTIPNEIKSNAREIVLRFENLIGGVIGDLWSLSGNAGYLAMNACDMPEPWGVGTIKQEAAQGDEQHAHIVVGWGLE